MNGATASLVSLYQVGQLLLLLRIHQPDTEAIFNNFIYNNFSSAPCNLTDALFGRTFDLTYKDLIKLKN